jgi:hypothetical protein
MMDNISQDKDLPNNAWEHVQALFERPYFYRLWVIQEVVNAKENLVICGDKITFWLHLSRALAFASWWASIESAGRGGRGGLVVPELVTTNVILIDTLAEGRHRHRLKFSELVFLCRPLETTDPRDRLFALTGLLLTEREWFPLPDYHSSTEEVFRDFAVLDLEHSRSVELLS